jgi:hypothetical protein
MACADTQLFSVVEVLARFAENKEQGCLLVSKAAELIHIYVKDGFVIRASSGTKESEQAVEQAIHLANVTYTWLRGVQPPPADKLIFLNIKGFIAKQTNGAKPKMIETSRLAGSEKKEKEAESKYRYYLVPQDNLMEKIYLTKTSTVLGRADTSDIVIANSDVSSRHCILDIQTRGVFILDLDSTNGTFVNGNLVRDGYLNAGDRIELGPCLYVINREVLPPI